MRFCFNTVLISLFLCFACSSTKVHNNYRLRKNVHDLSHPTLIRTDGVYVSRMVLPNFNHVLYQYIRFYNNGRCFYSKVYVDKMPGKDTLILSHLDFGEQTFFKIKENNFKIEVWANNNLGYMYECGVAGQDSLLIDKYQPRGTLFKKRYELMEQKRYSFIPLEISDSAVW